MTLWSRSLGLVALLLGAISSPAQHIPGYNYDEASLPAYTLIDPLTMADGRPVRSPDQWWTARRPEIVRLFEQNVFGRIPPAAKFPLRFDAVERDAPALGGRARRSQTTIYLTPAGQDGPKLHLLLYLPAHPKHRVRVILGLNFGGNQTVLADPAILLTPVWVKDKTSTLPSSTIPPESSRGRQIEEWQVERVIERGYGLATAYYGDIEPDFKGAGNLGVRHALGGDAAPDGWGALAAWAWGLSRAVDYLQTLRSVDPHGVVVTGHSRLGKAADWAAAIDPRIAAVLSTESGKGGQSLYRRVLGENIEHLQHSFPYWFCPNYATWVHRDLEIPVDGNLLLTLIAPRPLYVASAVEDEWSDPRGEFLSAVDASRVYRLLGKRGIETHEMPPVNTPLLRVVAYHVRSGKHDVTAFDWQSYLTFLDLHFGPQK